MSTRGWVTVNVYWLIQKGLEEVRLVPPIGTKQTIEFSRESVGIFQINYKGQK